MTLPATDNCNGTDGDNFVGRTLTTGGLTWLDLTGGGGSPTVSSNRFWGSSYTGLIGFNAGAADVVEQVTVKANSQLTILFIRSNSSGTAYLQAWFDGSSGRVRVFDESLTLQGSMDNTGAAIGAGDMIEFTANGTALECLVNGTSRTSGTSSTHQTNTYCGIRVASGEFMDDYSVDAFAIATPVATLTKANTTTVFLAGTAGTAGTTPQWARSLTDVGGYSNLSNGGGVSGATSYALTDASVTPGTPYYYKFTDTSGTSNVQTARTWKRPAYVEFIGDSVTAGFNGTVDPVVQFGISAKKAAGGERDVIAHRTVDGSGTHAYEWYDATSGTPVQSNLSTASAGGISAGCTHAMITLGINDSFSVETTAQYQANLAGICAYLLGQGYTAVILNYPTGYAPDGSTGSYAKLLSLTANIEALINGTTILRGDTSMLSYLPDHAATELQASPNQVHPNDTGYRAVGEAWAFAWARAVGDLPVGGGILRSGGMSGGMQKS